MKIFSSCSISRPYAITFSSNHIYVTSLENKVFKLSKTLNLLEELSFSFPTDIDFYSSYLFIAGEDGLKRCDEFFNILASSSIPIFGIDVAENYVFGVYESTIYKFAASDLSLVSAQNLDCEALKEVFCDGQFLFLAADGKVQVLNLNLEEVAFLEDPILDGARDIWVDGEFVFVSGMEADTFSVFQFIENSLVLVTSYSSLQRPAKFFLRDNLVYVSSYLNDVLCVLKFENGKLSLVEEVENKVSGIHDIIYDGSRLYFLSHDSGEVVGAYLDEETIESAVSMVTAAEASLCIAGEETISSSVVVLTETQATIEQTGVEEFDVQVRVSPEVPASKIQIYVPGRGIFDCDLDEIEVSTISRRIEREHGISEAGSVSIVLSNIASRYFGENSIFNEQILSCPIRVYAGWGHLWANDAKTLFSGFIEKFEVDVERKVTIEAQDALRKLIEFRFDNGITLNEELEPTMHPIKIIEVLIRAAGIYIYNFEGRRYESVLDEDSFLQAFLSTQDLKIEETVYDSGTSLMEIIQELMLISNAKVFVRGDGKISVKVDSERDFENLKAFSYQSDILNSQRILSGDEICNSLTIGKDEERVTLTDDDSINIYGKRAREISLKLNCSADDILNAAYQYFVEASPNTLRYEFSLSCLTGKALNIELGEIIYVEEEDFSDYVEVRKIEIFLAEQIVRIEGISASRFRRKYALFCSEIDEGDGLGVSAQNFDLWDLFFGYACYATQSSPYYEGGEVGFDLEGNHNGKVENDVPPFDSHGNSIELPFVAF